jgi:hypothetical protein
MDEWILLGDVTAPSDRRAHSLSDGIVLVGIKPMIKQLIPVATDCISINGGTNLIEIKNAVNGLVALVGSLIDTIKALGTVGSAAAQTIDPASKALLELEKAKWALVFK